MQRWMFFYLKVQGTLPLKGSLVKQKRAQARLGCSSVSAGQRGMWDNLASVKLRPKKFLCLLWSLVWFILNKHWILHKLRRCPLSTQLALFHLHVTNYRSMICFVILLEIFSLEVWESVRVDNGIGPVGFILWHHVLFWLLFFCAAF